MKKILTLLAAATVAAFYGVSAAQAADNTETTAFDVTTMEKPEGKEAPAYLRGAYIDAATAKSKLQAAGYTIVGEYKVLKDGMTILFTDDALKAEGAKEDRGFAAVERLYVDDTNKQITITNPVYFGKAYMQDDYNHAVFYKELQTLASTFGELKASVDKLDFDDLSGYHFMMGMPYYEDMIEVAEGSHADLVAKAKASKEFLFELKLSDNATLVGMELEKKTTKFPKKIGLQNGLVLPYMVLIEGDKAKALHGKFYIALSYPLLTMGEFMHIASIPGAIETDLQKPFN